MQCKSQLAQRAAYQIPDATILNLQKDLLRLEQPFPVGQQLREIEERDALGEELSNHAA